MTIDVIQPNLRFNDISRHPIWKGWNIHRIPSQKGILAPGIDGNAWRMNMDTLVELCLTKERTFLLIVQKNT